MSTDTGSVDLAGNASGADATWRSLYRLGGVAALIATALFVCDIVVLAAGGAAPDSARAWFALLQDNRAAGLLHLFFTDLIGVALMAPLILALYTALRRASPAYAALATALALIGIAAAFAANTNYSLLYLAGQYAAATVEAERSQLLATAESILANGMWSTGPLMAGLFLECALLMISAIMLRGRIFARGIAYLGILAHGLDLAHAVAFLVLIPVSSIDMALAIGTPLLAVGGTLQLLWYPLVGRRLLQLGHEPVPTAIPREVGAKP